MGNLGGIRTPGVAASSSYASKDFTKKVTPKKVTIFLLTFNEMATI